MFSNLTDIAAVGWDVGDPGSVPQLTASLDQIDAKAEDIRLHGESEAKVWSFPGDLSGDLIKRLMIFVWASYRGGDSFQLLVKFCKPGGPP